MVLSCAGGGQQDTFPHSRLISSEPQNTGTLLSFERKSYSNENHFYLCAGMPPSSSSLVYFWEMSGSAASLLSCVGQEVKCFLSNFDSIVAASKRRRTPRCNQLVLRSGGSSKSG